MGREKTEEMKNGVWNCSEWESMELKRFQLNWWFKREVEGEELDTNITESDIERERLEKEWGDFLIQISMIWISRQNKMVITKLLYDNKVHIHVEFYNHQNIAFNKFLKNIILL